MESDRHSSKYALLVKRLRVAIYDSRAANVRKEYEQGGEAASVCEGRSSLSSALCSVLTKSLCNAILVEITRLAVETWRASQRGFTHLSSRLSQRCESCRPRLPTMRLNCSLQGCQHPTSSDISDAIEAMSFMLLNPVWS